VRPYPCRREELYPRPALKEEFHRFTAALISLPPEPGRSSSPPGTGSAFRCSRTRTTTSPPGSPDPEAARRSAARAVVSDKDGRCRYVIPAGLEPGREVMAKIRHALELA